MKTITFQSTADVGDVVEFRGDKTTPVSLYGGALPPRLDDDRTYVGQVFSVIKSEVGADCYAVFLFVTIDDRENLTYEIEDMDDGRVTLVDRDADPMAAIVAAHGGVAPDTDR
jgi:hypothetical protein